MILSTTINAFGTLSVIFFVAYEEGREGLLLNPKLKLGELFTLLYKELVLSREQVASQQWIPNDYLNCGRRSLLKIF